MRLRAAGLPGVSQGTLSNLCFDRASAAPLAAPPEPEPPGLTLTRSPTDSMKLVTALVAFGSKGGDASWPGSSFSLHTGGVSVFTCQEPRPERRRVYTPRKAAARLGEL